MGALASPRRLQTAQASLAGESTLQAVGGLLLTPARTGDQHAIHQLLQQVFRGPSLAEFQLQQEEPGYLPAQRLVVREGQRIVGHLRLALREMRVGDDWLPVARLFDLCVLPEFRGKGVATKLLLAAEQSAQEQGATLLATQTSQVGMFERLGWFAGGRQSYSLVGPREVLAEMERRKWEQAAQHQASDDLPQLSRYKHPLTVRRWKQTEHAAVQRLYQEGIAGLNGPLARSDDYWRWLIARQAYDWFYVAIEGPDRTLFDDIQGHIVGYMFLKSNRIVELVASPSCARANDALLARACRDAIEQSLTPLRLDAPADHSIQEIVAAAGGKTAVQGSDADARIQVKAVDLARLAAATLSTSYQGKLTLELRSDSAASPLRRQLARSNEPTRFVLDGGQFRVDPISARPHVTCSRATFVQLLLGHSTINDAIEGNRLRTASRAAREALEQAIPQRSLWYPPFDDLLA